MNIMKTITYHEKEYPVAFTLNVMQSIQEEYGTLDHWGELTDGAKGEPDAKAIIFAYTEMINEGIDIYKNDHPDSPKQFLTKKQVGRIITEVGLANATQMLNQTVIESSQSAEKNA